MANKPKSDLIFAGITPKMRSQTGTFDPSSSAVSDVLALNKQNRIVFFDVPADSAYVVRIEQDENGVLVASKASVGTASGLAEKYPAAKKVIQKFQAATRRKQQKAATQSAHVPPPSSAARKSIREKNERVFVASGDDPYLKEFVNGKPTGRVYTHINGKRVLLSEKTKNPVHFPAKGTKVPKWQPAELLVPRGDSLSGIKQPIRPHRKVSPETRRLIASGAAAVGRLNKPARVLVLQPDASKGPPVVIKQTSKNQLLQTESIRAWETSRSKESRAELGAKAKAEIDSAKAKLDAAVKRTRIAAVRSSRAASVRALSKARAAGSAADSKLAASKTPANRTYAQFGSRRIDQTRQIFSSKRPIYSVGVRLTPGVNKKTKLPVKIEAPAIFATNTIIGKGAGSTITRGSAHVDNFGFVKGGLYQANVALQASMTEKGAQRIASFSLAQQNLFGLNSHGIVFEVDNSKLYTKFSRITKQLILAMATVNANVARKLLYIIDPYVPKNTGLLASTAQENSSQYLNLNDINAPNQQQRMFNVSISYNMWYAEKVYTDEKLRHGTAYNEKYAEQIAKGVKHARGDKETCRWIEVAFREEKAAIIELQAEYVTAVQYIVSNTNARMRMQ